MLLPTNLLPTDLLPWGLLPGVGSGYRVYGPYLSASAATAGVEAGDTPAATVPAGSTSIAGLPQDVSTVRYWAVTSVSVWGVESEPMIVRAAMAADGSVTGARPAGLSTAHGVAIADGHVRVTASYVGVGRSVTATQLQVALVTDGVADWGSPLGTATLAGQIVSASVDVGPFPDGQPVRLAVRAATADGVGGPETVLPSTIADATAPDAVSTVTAGQE